MPYKGVEDTLSHEGLMMFGSWELCSCARRVEVCARRYSSRTGGSTHTSLKQLRSDRGVWPLLLRVDLLMANFVKQRSKRLTFRQSQL